MTDAEILAFVNAYFAAHLDKSYWTGLDSDTQSAAVVMATADICAKLEIDAIDANNIPSQKAVA